MAETDFEDRAEVGFADFNPTWFFPNISVKPKYENITFGMDADHILINPPHPKDALISQSPTVVFKAATVLQSLGIIASRVLPPSSDTRERGRIEHTVQRHGTTPTSTTLLLPTAINFERKEQHPF